MTRFFMSVATQFENLGDALIHRELALLAAAHGPVLVEWSRCPERFRRTLDLEGQPGITTMAGRGAFLRAMLGARARGERAILLLKPGAYLGPLGLPRWRAEAVLAFNRALAAAGVELMQLGASYERLDAANAAFLARKSAALACHYVRDEQSRHYAWSVGIAVDGVLPDLAFTLYGKSRRPVAGPGAPLTLALSFRTGQYAEQEEQLRALVSQAIAALGREAIGAVRLVAQVTWDKTFLAALAEWLEGEHAIAVTLVDAHDSLETARSAYSGCDLLLSNRLHALLVGGTLVPRVLACVDRTHNAKIVGLFETCGWTKSLFVLDGHAQLTPEVLANAMSAPIDGAPFAAELERGFAAALAGVPTARKAGAAGRN